MPPIPTSIKFIGLYGTYSVYLFLPIFSLISFNPIIFTSILECNRVKINKTQKFHSHRYTRRVSHHVSGERKSLHLNLPSTSSRIRAWWMQGGKGCCAGCQENQNSTFQRRALYLWSNTRAGATLHSHAQQSLAHSRCPIKI